MYKFHLVPLFSAIVNCALGILAFSTNPRRRLNQIFLILGFGLAWWNFAAYLHASTQDIESSLRLYRIGGFGVALLPAAIFHMAVEISGRKRFQRYIVLAYLFSLLFCALLIGGYSMSSGVRKFGNMYRINGSPAVWFFYGWFCVVGCSSVSILAGALRRESAHSRRVVGLLLSGISILCLGVMHDGMQTLGLNHYPGTQIAILPLGTACALLYALILGYGLLSDQLLDFRVSIGRNSATLLRITFLLSITYVLLLSAAGLFPGTFTGEGLLTSMLTFFISTVVTVRFFPKLLGDLSSHLGQHLTGDRFESHDKIRAFIKEYRRRGRSFSQYLDDSAKLLLEQVKLSAVGIAVTEGDKDARGQAIRETEATRDWSGIFGEESPLRKYFKAGHQQPIDIRDGLQFGAAERATRTLMTAQSLVLAFPIVTDDKKTVGLLVVGPRRDGRALNGLDVEVLASLCHHIAVRVERTAVDRNEELQQANEAKDQFLASINHEIRNPLNGITGIVQMLKEDCKEGRSAFLLRTLEVCTYQLRTTMDDVLDFNKIGREVAVNHPIETEVVQLVTSTISSQDMSGEQLVFDGVTGDLQGADPGNPQIRVLCDAGKLSHILMNYLTNAVKYGVPAGAHVQLHSEPVGGGLARIKIMVTSTGPTLPREELLRLFTPLTRGRRAHETKAHGVGLGLALCKKLAQAMNANVGVESANGKTTFWFLAELPLAHTDGLRTEQSPLKVAGRYALAIEDEPYNRLVLGYQLNRFGIYPIWAEDGQSALAAAQNRAFDLIVMDWRLPDMEGGELISRLRAIHPTTLPPIVVVSAYSTASKRATVFAAGAAAFVSKPIDETKLAEALALCQLGPPIAGAPTEDSAVESIDLSALQNASKNPEVIETFLTEIEQSHSKLVATWQTDARAAASLAHRLKGQMLIVRAKDCADLLALLEQSLGDGGSTEDVGRLLETVTLGLNGVTRAIRARANAASSRL
jgi:signal transduction histidine kinase/DNA-binding NarL/FixJ family response regulator